MQEPWPDWLAQMAGELLFIIATLTVLSPLILLAALLLLLATCLRTRPPLHFPLLVIAAQTAITAAHFVPQESIRILWLEPMYMGALALLALAAAHQTWNHPQLRESHRRAATLLQLSAIVLLPPFAAVIMLLLAAA